MWRIWLIECCDCSTDRARENVLGVAVWELFFIPYVPGASLGAYEAMGIQGKGEQR
jgi:hypothetical protein